MAMDAQGAARARPFVQEAGLTLPALVDRRGTLWEAFDFQVVPVQLYFDETGDLVYRTIGAPRGDVIERLDAALAEPKRSRAAIAAAQAASTATEAGRLFAQGVEALDAGHRDEAVVLWRRALERDPENWLIRKQIWALENPDRFYGDEIDVSWQRRRLAEEKPASTD